MATENWFDRQQASFRLLQTLVRERAAGETALGETYAATVDAAEKEIAKVRRVLGTAKARALGEHAAERAASESQMQSIHSDLESAATSEYRQTKTRTEQKQRAAEAQIKSETRDRIWTVDSLHEAGEKQALELKDRKSVV